VRFLLDDVRLRRGLVLRHRTDRLGLRGAEDGTVSRNTLGETRSRSRDQPDRRIRIHDGAARVTNSLLSGADALSFGGEHGEFGRWASQLRLCHTSAHPILPC
jgi:hypothetical protein